VREKGHAAFHSPGRNQFFISWGSLKEAEEKFPTLEGQAEGNIKRLRKLGDVKNLDVKTSNTIISGHDAILSDVNAEVVSGGLFFSRSSYMRRLCSAHLRCPQSERYFVLYSNNINPREYPNFQQIVEAMENSFRCHLASENFRV
jgi:hypothetical protein